MLNRAASYPGQGNRSVLQIVPFRTSRQDGIGDYALGLASGLRLRHGIETSFLSGTPQAVYPAPADEWPSSYVGARTPADFLEAMRAVARVRPFSGLIIHVGGYGYAKRGAPLWLMHGLRAWRRSEPAPHVLGIFHELYASGKPWNSSFWLGPLQKYVARQLWHLADKGITTNSRYLADLVSWRPDMADRAVLMPVPSNVGEADTAPPTCTRPDRAIVFGSAGVENLIYARHAEEVAGIVGALGITEIVDVGSRRIEPPSRISGASVRVLGRLSAPDISRILLGCRFGLINYDTTRLGKSGVFASYAAHGVIPICLGSQVASADGLMNGQHFLQPPIESANPEQLADIQHRLSAWYSQHSSERLIDTIATMCLPQFDQSTRLDDRAGERFST